MKRYRISPWVLKAFVIITLLGSSTAFSIPQMPPQTLAIVRNDSTSKVSVEYQSNGTWQSVSIEPNRDTNIRGERIRVSTTRDDNAVITVDLPISSGKKYRVFWNSQANMWDLGGTTG